MKSLFLTHRVLVLLAAAISFAPGCGRETRTQTAEYPTQEPARSPVEARRVAGSTEQRRAEFLNRIRSADPRQQTIERAMLNEQNELGLILNRQTDLDDVPKLLRSMLAELDKSFPNQDHTAVAYTPTNPPRTIGTARLNARTRDMTYTPASP
jgi:hypothetical protein